jgi:hypothetical protein
MQIENSRTAVATISRNLVRVLPGIRKIAPVEVQTAECMQRPLPVTFARSWNPENTGLRTRMLATLTQNSDCNKLNAGHQFS